MSDLPYIIITKKLGPDAEKWCRDNIGERWFAVGRKTGNWTYFFASDIDRKSYRWHFRNEKDAFWFSLRWR
jgi:hypothetical protein